MKSEPARQELIFALIGPAGVRLDDLSKALRESLGAFGYKVIEIRLSELLKRANCWLDEPNAEQYKEYVRVTHRQKMALEFRRQTNDAAALARAGIAALRAHRKSITGDYDRPAEAHAYVISQLKHPREVELLRAVYGSSLYVLAGHAPESRRIETLAKRIAREDGRASPDNSYTSKAMDILHIDDKQAVDQDLGQNTRDAYPMSDFFLNLGLPGGENAVQRFLELVFGHPFHTPFPDEVAMYQANSLSLASSDESRQVGAVIVTQPKDFSRKPRGPDIVASGMNEVPRRGGGYYGYLDSPDMRDQALRAQGIDPAHTIKLYALIELIEKIRDRNWLSTELAETSKRELAIQLLPALKGTQFMDIGEFMRPVHAEMAALIDAARRGVAVHELAMYVTAFPCHNCAKHIIAAGLRRVIYLEPYPKSRAKPLHGEEIDLESIDGFPTDDRVVFAAFTGVAPRQYQRLFSMGSRGRKRGLSLGEWGTNKLTLGPKYAPRNAAAGYLVSESEELALLPASLYSRPDQ
jgi:deoxycytidylate deaminase